MIMIMVVVSHNHDDHKGKKNKKWIRIIISIFLTKIKICKIFNIEMYFTF